MPQRTSNDRSATAGRDAPEHARRVFLECTSTLASRYNTGIQRAGRNLVNASLSLAGPWTCTPIAYNGRHFIAIDRLPPQAVPVSGQARMNDRLRRIFHRARAATTRVIPGAPVRQALHSQRLEYSLRQMVHRVHNAWRWLCSFRSAGTERVEFRNDDVLVLLDPSWSIDLSRELKRAREAGAKVWVVINDLIPVNHPDLAPEGTPILMDRWLRRVLPYATGMLGISRSVADDLRRHLASLGLAQPPIGYFYLGAGLDVAYERHPQAGRQRDVIVEACSGAAAYLAVGTVEPRKNHRLILEVFDRLWADNVDVRLLIFGRLGWRSEQVARRLREHAEYGRRLFWFETGSDEQLDYAYRHASALIFASRCEGFGLPLVEAIHYGLPVLASDIAVFREIGGDYPIYFDPVDPGSLEMALRRHRAQGGSTSSTRRAPRAWLSWAESARMLLETVAATAESHASLSAGSATWRSQRTRDC
jgi:alpha-1,2-rhamnosyltransferase